MMPGKFLTPDDLKDLTDMVIPSAQARWLERNGWKFVLSAAGRPKVLWSYAEFRLGVAPEPEPDCTTQPDFSRWINKT